jgi:hypothetical protein
MSVKAEDNIMLESQKIIHDIAANTDQYFWHTSTGTDTGAHITEKTKEDFLDDPANGGGNLLARSNGIAVRDGLTELSSFSANGASFGKNNPVAEISFNDRHGILYGKDYAGLQYGLELGIEDRDPDNKWADDYNNLMTRMFVEKIPDNTKEYHAFLDLEAFDDSSHYTLTCNGNRYDSEGEELPSVSPKNIGRLEINSTRGYAFVGNMAMAGGTVEDYGVGVITTLSNDGTYSTTDIDIMGNRILFNGNVIHSSDKRLKEHIEEVDDKAVKFIRSLKPVRFKLRGEEMTGFYAQDVEEIDPWGCFVSENENGYKALNYTGLIAPLVAYCQHLEDRIRKLEEK